MTVDDAPLPCHPLDTAPETGRHVALVPGAEVPLLALDLPAGLRGPAREDVARRQLRDRIGPAGETVEMRPYTGRQRSEYWTRALVADAAHLAAWRAAARPGARAVLPDYLALPAAADLWVIGWENGSVQARLGLEDGFSADPDLALAMLGRALAEGAAPTAILALGPVPGALRDLAARHDVALYDDAAALARAGHPAPRAFAHGELALDLRADPRAARARLAARLLPWRWPVLIALGAVALWSAAEIVAIRALEDAARTERAAIRTALRDGPVPSGPILDIRAQVSRALETRRAAARDWQGRAAPLTLFGRIAGAVAASPAISESYAYEDGAWEAVLRLADFAAAEALVADLRAAGLTVAVADLRAQGGRSGVRAVLRLGAGP